MYKTITLDWLGFGQSDKPFNHTYSFTNKSKILDTVLSSLLAKDEKITLVAHDIGGPPAILWASEHPERVERLILLNTVVYTIKTSLDAFSEVLLATPLLKDLFVSSYGLKKILKTNTKSRGKDLDQIIDQIIRAYRGVNSKLKRKTITEPMHLGRQDELLILSKKFKELSIPKHLIIARQDPLCYKHIYQLHLENPEVPAHFIPNCGHFMPIDQPNALTEILLQILRSTD